MIHKDDRVRSRQSQAETANARSQEQDVDTGIIVERLHDIMSMHGIGRAVQAHIAHAGHQFDEELGLNNVQHVFRLRKYEDAVIGCGAGISGGVQGIARSTADTAIQKKLSLLTRFSAMTHAQEPHAHSP